MTAAKSPRVRLDPFVAAVRKDPGDSAPLCFLSGFVGRSPTEGKLRIYPDAGFSHWVEAAEEDVLHAVPLADSPLGGSHLWLKGSARLSPGVAGGPTQPPTAIQQQAPAWPQTLLGCPFQPFTLLGCTGFACPAARPEPAFTEPTICPAPSGQTPCVTYTEAVARAWYTVHFCASPQAAFAHPIGQTGWQTCACPGPSAVDACPTRLCIPTAEYLSFRAGEQVERRNFTRGC